jgi:hypothetical protein
MMPHIFVFSEAAPRGFNPPARATGSAANHSGVGFTRFGFGIAAGKGRVVRDRRFVN